MTPDTCAIPRPSFVKRFLQMLLRVFFVQKSAEGYRTFHGVFLPSFLSIVGVILYLRLGFIIGEMGFFLTASIISLATLITLITAFSISATSTNMKVENGGAYFLISRAFGKVIGSAVGIPLYCAQAIGIAFYTMGLAEAIHYLVPTADLNVLEFSVLAGLGVISLLSTTMVLRAQFIIFLIVIASLLSFYLGMDTTNLAPPSLTAIPKMGYWAAFALFFPAVTGLEAGISMSGELKNARRSLPLGTITAVLAALAIYLSSAFLLWVKVPRETLVEDSMIMVTLAWSFPLIILGLFGAILSSALGAIIAAPRTLQAIALDGVVPKFFGKEYGKSAEPRAASVLTMVIAATCLYLGDLNFIAPILTMFFLICYGMLNLAAGLESLMNNPSWRPTIYIPASISLIGATLCILTMLLIDASYTMMAGLAVTALYFLIQRRETRELDDIRQGVMIYLMRKMIYRLSDATLSPRSWRPNILALSPSLNPPAPLLDFTSAITGGKGFLTLAHCYRGDQDAGSIEKMKGMLKQTLKNQKIESLVEVIKEQDIAGGFKTLVETYGLNPLKPNTVVISLEEDNFDEALAAEIALSAHRSHKNLIFLYEAEKSLQTSSFRHIDIWWDDDLRESNDLMILMAHMYGKSHKRKRFQINLNSIVKDEVSRKNRQEHFQSLLTKNRLEIRKNVYVSTQDDLKSLIPEFSDENGMIFMPIRAPYPDENNAHYAAYLREIVSKTGRKKLVSLFLATDKIELDAIVRSMK